MSPFDDGPAMGFDQEPLPPFIGSIALARRFVDEVEEWLAIWNEERRVFEFPQSSWGEDETFRSCLDEELEATLDLNRKSDYLISGLPRDHYQAPIEWPGHSQPQWVIVEFFAVDLYGKKAAGVIDGMSHVRWLTASELQEGCTSDGDPIRERQHHIMKAAHVLPFTRLES